MTSTPYMDGGDGAVSWITTPHDGNMVETTELRKPPTTFGFPSLLQSASLLDSSRMHIGMRGFALGL